MTVPNPWLKELWRVLAMFGALFALGLVVGHVAWALLAGVIIYLGWHLYNLYLLQRWLREGRSFHPPESRGVWDDVFERIYRLQHRNRKRKRKLAKMLTRFQEATAALPDATVVLQENANEIEWWNNAARELLGLRSPRDVGQRISNLLRHPHFTQYLAAGDFSEPILIPSPRDEGAILSVRIVPYGKGRQLVVARDVTRLERLEQARRDFVANASHELRSPLTVLSGYLETMLDDEREHPVWGRSLATMCQQAQRMRSIVDDLLLLSRLETGHEADERTPVDVPGMLAQILEEAKRLSGDRHHRFKQEVASEFWLLGNESELRSAFSNLIFNAVRYTAAEGLITVRWRGGADGAHFEVEDTGIGIAPQHVPRLTERFYRVDKGRSRDTGGTGLGLAIVKHVLLRHGTRLQIRSELGKGSVFHCCFAPGRTLLQKRRTPGSEKTIQATGVQ